MIFPELRGQRGGYLNLNLLTVREGLNIFLDAQQANRMIVREHERLGIAFSYGGWMEDRSTLVQGTYLQNTQESIHLGIDINAPTGTLIATDNDAQVIRVDDDHPEALGWGPRVFLRLKHEPVILLYAHLDPERECVVGDVLKAGDVFAKVGPPSHNGGWFSHTHVQMLTEEAFRIFEKDPNQMDGYARVSEIERIAKLCPDPTSFLHLR